MMGFARSGLGVIVMTNRRFSNAQFYLAIILTLFLVSNSGSLCAAENGDFTYDFFSFNHITAEQGRKYLADAKIGDVSHLPDSPTVLVTSSIPDNLQKARVVRDIVDSSQEYAVRIIPFTSMAKKLPSNEQITDNIGTIAIGNFSNPPALNGNARTIVDTCKSGIIIITPSRMMDRIVNTIEKLQNTNPQDILSQKNMSQPAKSNDMNSGSVKSVKNEVPSIIPALFAENISENKPENDYLNQRITDSAPVAEQVSSETETGPVQTQSNLLAENSLIDISSIPNPDDEVILNLTDQLTLIEFLGWVGPYLKMDFMYNAKDFANQDVTINPNGVLKGPVKIRDLYYYLDSVLKFKGFVMTRGGKGNLVTIVPRDNALDIDPVLGETGKASIEAGDTVRTESFELKNISTSTAEELIKNMKLSIQITTMPETKTLLVTEYTSRMPRIKALLDMVDKPGEPKQFRYRQLQYTMSQTLAPKIQSLAEQLGTVSITISTAGSVATPDRPVKRPNESDAAYASRLRSWEAQVRSLSAAASSTRTPAPTAPPGESAPTVFLDSDERTNRILMIGLKKQLDEVDNLIDTLDVAQRDPRKLQIYKIEFLDAEEVMKKLEDLNVIPKSQGTSDTSRTRPNQPSRITPGEASVREPVSITAGSTGGDSETLVALAEEPVVVLVASTNSLLVNATEEQHVRISTIIDLVDKAREEIPYKVYKLKNANPEYLQDILKQLVEEKVRGPEDKIESVVPKLDAQITIVADPNTSSLIVYANKKNQDWIESLIRELDKRKPQVLIDVILVQISKTDAFDYDLNLISSFPDLTDTSGLTNAIMPGISAGASNLFDPPSGSDRGNRAHYLDFQSNGGSGTGFYGDKHINALLKLMEQKDYGRVMAKPKILVNDNQMGIISTTDTTYVKKTSSIPVSSGGAGTETSLIQTAIDYTPYNAGITLNITPHISESDLLRLDIDLTRSDFGTITGERPPDTTDSTVGTTVTVPDGSTIILGGLLKMNQSKGGTKIPILGDIPFIGTLFRSVNNSDIQRNLYVFVKAEIIRPPDDNTAQVDLERISKVNRDAFEKYENEFQNYHSFPGVTPAPMAPDKVLDAK